MTTFTNPTVHEPATIHGSVLVGENCTIWQYATICEEAVLGEGVVVGSHAWVGRGTNIGAYTRIQHGAFICNNMVIGKRVFIGPMVVCCDDKYPRVNNIAYDAQPPIIEDNVSIGAGAIILPGVRIGVGAMIGAGAVVSQDVQSMMKVLGIPARATLSKREGRICVNCNTSKPISEYFPIVREKYLQSWCRHCRNTCHLDPIKKKAKSKRYYSKLRLEVLTAYSNGTPSCQCCGEIQLEFLALDHINNDGAKHRRLLGRDRGTTQVYIWARENGYPQGLQVLCHNCNIGKHHNNGRCPHILDSVNLSCPARTNV